MQEELCAYFGLHNVMELQLFNLNSERNIESHPQWALVFADGTTITSPRVVICTSVKIDVQTSVMKRKMI